MSELISAKDALVLSDSDIIDEHIDGINQKIRYTARHKWRVMEYTIFDAKENVQVIVDKLREKDFFVNWYMRNAWEGFLIISW